MKAIAKVIVVLEVETAQPWGGDATVDQVWTQAVREAVAKVERMVGERVGIRIVGKPKPTCVVTTEEA
jgi:hypothetical protein